MNFNFTEEQQAIAELADQIIGDHSDPAALREIELGSGPRFDAGLWSALAEAGLLGIAAPESAGGAGLGLVEAALVIRASALHAAAAPVWETLGLGIPVLSRYVDNEVAAGWLAKAASGEAIVTAAWHEELGEPLDPQLVTATADGPAWSLRGTKVLVPAGLIANAVIVPARTESGPALFLVDLSDLGDAERVEVRTTAATPDANLHFANTAATLLATGDEAIAWAYDRAVATQCAAALGTAESALRITADYTKERKQFDVPIATFQAVGHRAADSYIDVESIRLTTMQALWLLAADRDATIEVSAAQYWAAQSGQRVSLAAAHLHGGVGGDRDYPLHRYFIFEKQYELHLGGASAALRRLGRQIAANA
ncbi:MAG: acyl-CoA dehydrogenase family protein [Microthrixaceae bacterium]